MAPAVWNSLHGSSYEKFATVTQGAHAPKSCPVTKFLIGSIVISLSRCCQLPPNWWRARLPKYFFHRTAITFKAHVKTELFVLCCIRNGVTFLLPLAPPIRTLRQTAPPINVFVIHIALEIEIDMHVSLNVVTDRQTDKQTDAYSRSYCVQQIG